MSKKKAIYFTDEDLRTLTWALNNQYHHTVLCNVRNGRPAESKASKHLVKLTQKVYSELIRRLQKEAKNKF